MSMFAPNGWFLIFDIDAVQSIFLWIKYFTSIFIQGMSFWLSKYTMYVPFDKFMNFCPDFPVDLSRFAAGFELSNYLKNYVAPLIVSSWSIFQIIVLF